MHPCCLNVIWECVWNWKKELMILKVSVLIITEFVNVCLPVSVMYIYQLCDKNIYLQMLQTIFSINVLIFAHKCYKQFLSINILTKH